MNAALVPLIVNDIRLQYRYGIYAAYGVVVAIYILGFVIIGPAMPGWLAGLLIYSDPSVLGFFFLGGLMMLEKNEGVRTALAITPVSATDYLVAKSVTLTAVALVAVIAMGLARSGPVHWPLLLVSVALTSVFYIAIGTGFALRFKTVNGYLIGSAGVLTPLVLPAGIAFLEPMPIAFGLVPTIAQPRLVMLAVGHGDVTGIEVAVMLGVLIASTLAAWGWALRKLASELGRA